MMASNVLSSIGLLRNRLTTCVSSCLSVTSIIYNTNEVELNMEANCAMCEHVPLSLAKQNACANPPCDNVDFDVILLYIQYTNAIINITHMIIHNGDNILLKL